MSAIIHSVQITADNTNVFSGTLAEKIPTWAKRGRIQLAAPDSDWTYKLSVAGVEAVRDSAAHIHAADNLQSVDWRQGHIEFPIKQGQIDFEILMNVNVGTAGIGLATIQYES